jgi:hypothetical protein
MKVVMIRSNTYVPDVRLEKKAASLSRNGYDIPLLDEIILITIHSRTKKNKKSNQIQRIRFKTPQGYFREGKFLYPRFVESNIF